MSESNAERSTLAAYCKNRYLFNIPLLETSTNSDGRKIRAEDALETVRRAVWELFGHDVHVAAHAVHESSKGPVAAGR